MTPCDTCPIRKGCDIFSEMCRLTPAEVPKLRPDLIRPMSKHSRYYFKTGKVKYAATVNERARRYRARQVEAKRRAARAA